MRHGAIRTCLLLVIALVAPVFLPDPAAAACLATDDASSGSEPVSPRCIREDEELDAEGFLGAAVNRTRAEADRATLGGWTDLLVASRWWAEQPAARSGPDRDVAAHVGHHRGVASLATAVEVSSVEPTRQELATAVDTAMARWQDDSAARGTLLGADWDHLGVGAELQFWTEDECAPHCSFSGRWEVVLVVTLRAADGQPPSPWSAYPVDGGRPPNHLTEAATFIDVPRDHVFHRDVERLVDADVTRGCNEEQTRFCPSDGVTRGQMAAFLVRALDLPPGTARFEDVPDDHVFVDDIAALADAGITRGCDPGSTRFCPERVLTRAEMAAFLVRALDLPAGDARFEDVPVDHVFVEDIAALADAGITRGCDADGVRFCPDASVTRGQMAAFLARSGVLDGGGAG